MLKGNLRAKICRLCFNTKYDVDFEVEEVIKEVLEIVLPKLNLEEGDKHLICNSCSVKLFAAFNFKSVCTDTEDTIFPYVNSQEMPFADLREIYLKEKGDIQFIDVLENQNVCRLCFQSVRYGVVSLNEVDADIINNYIPEVNFRATKDPVICKLCSDSLVAHGTFLSSCLAAQEENRKVPGDPAEDRECCIKTEEIKIEDDGDSNPPTRLENVETTKNFDGRFSSENKPANNKKQSPGKVQTYSCNNCNFKTVHKCSLKRHCLSHISLTPTYISLKSQCENESRDPLPASPLTRQERIYQCEKCPYRMHDKRAFIAHWLTHQVPSAVKVYQCEKCYHRATREKHFRRHQRSHEDGGIVQIYACDKCEFQTRYKCSLCKHQLLHKRKVWKGDNKNKSTNREVRHNSQVKTYKCKVCFYQTIWKSSFVRHQLRHEKRCEVKTYDCDKCSFTTEYKDNMKAHMLHHAQKKFKCRTCEFESDTKNKLASHRAKHSSDVKIYKCQVCSYQTTQKSNLVHHQLRHSKKCEVKTYDCDKCSFKSKHKQSLKRHVLRHSALA